MGLSDLPTTIWASKPQQNSPSPTLTDSRPGHDPTHTRRAAAHRGAEAKPRPGRYPRLAVTTGRHACTAGPGQTGQLSRPARRVGVRSHLPASSPPAPFGQGHRLGSIASGGSWVSQTDCALRVTPPTGLAIPCRTVCACGWTGARWQNLNTAQPAPEVMHSARRPCLSGQPTAHGPRLPALVGARAQRRAAGPDGRAAALTARRAAAAKARESLRRSGVGW